MMQSTSAAELGLGSGIYLDGGRKIPSPERVDKAAANEQKGADLFLGLLLRSPFGERVDVLTPMQLLLDVAGCRTIAVPLLTSSPKLHPLFIWHLA